jgi:hypothetical protein
MFGFDVLVPITKVPYKFWFIPEYGAFAFQNYDERFLQERII